MLTPDRIAIIREKISSGRWLRHILTTMPELSADDLEDAVGLLELGQMRPIKEPMFFAWQKRYGDSFSYEPIEATKPTDAKPGSAEKIEAMRQRLERGESLWHDDDMELQPGDFTGHEF